LFIFICSYFFFFLLITIKANKQTKIKMKMKGGRSSRMKGGCMDGSTLMIIIGLLALIAVGYYLITMYNNQNMNPMQASMQATQSPMQTPKIEGFEGDEITPKNGESVIALFAADWCPHCVNYKPTWKAIQEEAKAKKEKRVRFVTVDCTKSNPYKDKFDIKGYPTVLAISAAGHKDVEDRETLEGMLQSL
jgi:thiol-disulfide isomerase/thioredoxin